MVPQESFIWSVKIGHNKLILKCSEFNQNENILCVSWTRNA